MPVSRRRVLTFLSLSSVAVALPNFTWALGNTTAPAHRIAYVIGNAAYGEIGCGQKQCSLRSPEHDATAIGEFLTKSGFQAASFKNLAAKSLQDVVARFSREAALADVALLYYSGHAIQIDGQNFLIPVDVTDISEVLTSGLTPLDWALKADAGPDTIGIIMLDACRDNPFVSALTEITSEGDSPKKGLAPVEVRDRFIISYSTAANNVAADGDGIGLSPYAKAFVSCAQDAGITIQDTFAKTGTSVCDITTPAGLPGDKPRTDVFCQRPAIYSSLGAEPVYWTDSDNSAAPPAGPLLVNIKMGQAADPAVQAQLGNLMGEFAFNYVWQPAVAGRTEAQIIPDLEYFRSAVGRSRPFIIANDAGYYSPEEGATCWSLSYPILDIIARKLVRTEVNIKELIIESTQSRVDTLPYVDLLAPGTDVCNLTIVNQSWDYVTEVQLKFDVVGIGSIVREELQDYVDTQEKEKNYQIIYSVKNIDRHKTVNLSKTIEPFFLELKYYRFMGDKIIIMNENNEIEITKISTSKPVKVCPRGFEEWYRKHSLEFNGDEAHYLKIAGTMTSWNAAGESQMVDFAAGLTVFAPGVGGGTLDYNLKEIVDLPIDGKNHILRRAINKKLSKSSDVLRGIIALAPSRSSYHRLRFSLMSDEGVLYQSAWANTHIVVSRNDKEATVN